MTSAPSSSAPRTPAPAVRRTNYVGAVYGSLLAASVVAGTSAAEGPLEPPDLAIALVGTGLVFWLAHGYARLAGDQDGPPADRRRYGGFSMTRICAIAAQEWPVAEAAVPPTLATLAGWAVGLPYVGVTTLAIGVAVVGQVSWAVLASVRAGLSRRATVVSGFANLCMGLVIVALESALH